MKNTTINIPFGIIEEEVNVMLFPIQETEEKLGKYLCTAYGNGKTIEEAEQQFYTILKLLTDIDRERSLELDLWKPFQKGDWSMLGGTWVTIFGIHIYFRYGKNMKHGWFIPFTKLNISTHNYWLTRKK